MNTSTSSGPSSPLDYYARPAAMTSAGAHSALFEHLPHGLVDLVSIAQGLLIHEHIAPAYGVQLTDERRGSVHIRPVERLLDRLLADSDQPLTTARSPGERLAGNCRHFSVLMVAMLRSVGVPSRARCGFGTYFGNGFGEDHWVCEYWNAAQNRWILVDAQIDALQQGMFAVDFDLLDVPRDRFLVAADAWTACRAGDADPATFGLSFVNEAGYWWIAGNLLRDVAALSNLEMLPWDCWGAMPQPGETPDAAQVDLFDQLARVTRDPNIDLASLAAYNSDDRVRVPQTVFNAVLDREELV